MAIPPGHVANFETLERAMRNGDFCLLECTDAKTGAPVYAICAAQRNRDGSYEMKPLAKMFDGNPYEELKPPEV